MTIENIRIGILCCNDFSIVGGAERFIVDLADAFYATIVIPGYEHCINKTYKSSNTQFKCLNTNLPAEPLKQVIGSYLYQTAKLDFDFVISMDDMSVYALKNRPNHLYYILTPRRAFYDMYYDTMSTKKHITSKIYATGIWYFRRKDRAFVNKHVDNIACISNAVRTRIRSSYLRESEVIYPPVRCDRYECNGYGDYWLSVNRIDKWKRVDLQTETFRHMPDNKLVVVGQVYPGMEHIIDSAPDNVAFTGIVNEQELIELYSNCTGLLTTAINEDFGLTPLEAMASGKPVVATKEGGYLETVIDGHTGILVPPTTHDIVSAISQISTCPEKYHDACIQQAAKFDYPIFKSNINKVVKNIYENNALELF